MPFFAQSIHIWYSRGSVPEGK